MSLLEMDSTKLRLYFVFALAFSLSISPDDLQRIVSAVMKGLSQFD